MAWVVPLIGAIGSVAGRVVPLIGAIGSVAGGVNKQDAADFNASVYGNEGKVAAAQGYEAEASQRRKGAMELGRETAAAGQAGAGYQGSTGRSIKQSALNTELDALNIRYKANLQKWGYDTQSSVMRSESDATGRQTFLKAGGALLKGYGNYAGGIDLS